MIGTRANKFNLGLLAGGIATLLVFLLMGAVRNESTPNPPHLPVAVLDSSDKDLVALAASGRYQIVTWGSAGAYGAFVVDTSTGITKAVYSSVRGTDGKPLNNLGKPFVQIP